MKKNSRQEKIQVLGVNISLINNQTIIPLILEKLKQKKQIHIVTPNPEHIVEAQTNILFKNILNSADIAIPDGYGIVWAIKRKMISDKRQVRVERVTGSDLMLELCQLAAEKNWQVGLLGGQEKAAKLAAINLSKQVQNLKITDLPNYQWGQSDTKIIQKISDLKIDVLLVAFGAPKQELMISKNIKLIPKVKIAMGVGGAFDFYAGKTKRAPKWLQNLHLEWLYRLIQEPWRWRRQLKLIEFVWKVVIDPPPSKRD
jgi:N-acetylglucosaminyldiphosphoundecaprenol N-acetyl-beta-D-mannosaminyltransferase